MRVPIKRQVIQVISFCAALITVFAFTAPAVGGRCEFPSGCIQVCATVADWCPPVIGGTDPCDYPPPPTPLPPPDPPAEDDRTFVVEGESVECCADPIDPMFKATKSYSLKVRRIVGYTDRHGYLENPEDLIAKGVIGPFARLSIMAWDVDPGNECFPPEIDMVHFNKYPVRPLKGRHNEWHLTTFNIPISAIKFGVRERDKPLGSEPTAFRNKVRIRVDVGQSCWCTTIGWVALEIRAMSPVVLLHGAGGEGRTWEDSRMNFIEGLDDELIQYYYNITHQSDYVSVAASDINDELPGILQKFGVDSCHFIAHSKGGLDALEYLRTYYPSSELEVLSLTTLSSPLQGSAHADILVARDRAAPFIAYFKGFPAPFFVNLIANFFDVGPGEDASNLTTWFVFLKMAVWVPVLAAYDSTSFNTVSADMDLNSDKRINCFNGEAESLAGYVERFAPDLAKRPCILSWVADRMYQILLKVSTVRTRWRLFGGLIPYLEVTAVPTSTDQENDVLVTIASGRGNLAYRALVEGKEIIYNGWAGRTHIGVIQDEVAPDVVPWLVEQEHLHGDMRPF